MPGPPPHSRMPAAAAIPLAQDLARNRGGYRAEAMCC